MLITIIVVLIVLGLALYAAQLLPLDGVIVRLLQVVLILVAIVCILRGGVG